MTMEYLSELDVSNVYIYIGDAVRHDFLHERIRKRGVSVRSIAASTHSPTSFASLVTGRYPPRHGVETFTNRIAEAIPTLFDISDINTGFINSIFAFATREHTDSQDPIYSVLGLEQSESPNTEEITPPFALMERGPGGHAPYGDFDEGASQYFLSRAGAKTDTLRLEYARSIERDASLFEQRLEALDCRGLLDDTLVIYTSDHGEILGENGTLGHNGPMRPELVYIPTVFIHSDLPSIHKEQTTLHHVDLLPTVCNLLNCAEKYLPGMDGQSVLSGVTNDPRPCFWANQFLPDSVPLLSGRMDYRGVWNSTGGYVFTETNLPNRMAVLSGKLIKSSKRSYMRRNLLSGFHAYLEGETVYGEPDFPCSNAESILASASEDPASGVQTELSDEGRRQLQDLGYLE